MKKMRVIFILILSLLFITSCKKNDYKEGQLVELSGIELTKNFISEKSEDFIFATVNEDISGYKEFLVDLEKYAKETNKAIYFIYYNHIDSTAANYIFGIYDVDFTSNTYHVLEDGEITISENYINYDLLKQNLQDKRFYALLDYTSDEEASEILEEAKKLFEDGAISASLNLINKIWNKHEAKEFYEKHNEFLLLNSWEYLFTSKNTTVYRSLSFLHNTNYYLEYEANQKTEEFEKPDNLLDYKQQIYYVDDNIIYTKLDGEDKYKKRFKVIQLNNKSLTLYDYKNNKEFVYSRMV